MIYKSFNKADLIEFVIFFTSFSLKIFLSNYEWIFMYLTFSKEK